MQRYIGSRLVESAVWRRTEAACPRIIFMWAWNPKMMVNVSPDWR